jgi:hypothetical protein
MFFDPFTILAASAGVVSLASGVAKFFKDRWASRSDREVTIQNGDKKIVVTGLQGDELKKVLESFKLEAGSSQESKTPPSTQFPSP